MILYAYCNTKEFSYNYTYNFECVYKINNIYMHTHAHTYIVKYRSLSPLQALLILRLAHTYRCKTLMLTTNLSLCIIYLAIIIPKRKYIYICMYVYTLDQYWNLLFIVLEVRKCAGHIGIKIPLHAWPAPDI